MTTSNPRRNLAHLAVLAIWGLLGVAFTLQSMFGAEAGLATLTQAGMWWLWFVGLVAVTSAAVKQVGSPLAALGIHAIAFLVISALPRLFPLSLFRMGLDLLSQR